MKNVKRILAVIACVAMLCSVFVSCGDNTGDSANSKSPTGDMSFADVSIDFSGTLVVPNGKNQAEEESIKEYGHPGNPKTEYEVMEGERDPWLWPFSRTSVWNMPIGSNAKYESTGFVEYDELSCDWAWLLKTNKNDEVLDIVQSNMDDRWPADISSKKKNGTTYWPRGFTITKESPMNDCSAILQPDGRSIIELQPTCRDDASSTYVIGNPRHDIDIYSDGILGTHWGSGLATLGGCIRLGELTGDEPIRHALKINVWADELLYHDYINNGFTWPADRSDTKPTSKGTRKYMLEGTLLAIPRNITPESVGITDRIVKKLFVAAQDYGVYIVDDTVRGAYSISADIEEYEAVKEECGINMRTHISRTTDSATLTYAQDMIKLVLALKAVTNNSAQSIGGGGTPCQPLAPNFPSLK